MLSSPSLIAPGRFPSRLHQIIVNEKDDVWSDTLERLESFPEEIMKTGPYGQTALHSACLQYPPLHVIRAMLDTAPESASVQNSNGETALHIASECASENVQQLLVEVAPQSVAMVDKYGDSPLHMAARSGATFELLQQLCRASPPTVGLKNKSDKTPFWLLSKSYLEATSLEEVGGAEFENDWNCAMLFLTTLYNYNNDVNDEQQQPLPPINVLVHMAAATPACPRDLLSFLCRMCPSQDALRYNDQRKTPLLLAAAAPVMEEPHEWDEDEDGFREDVDAEDRWYENYDNEDTTNDDDNENDEEPAPVNPVALRNFANSAHLQNTLRETNNNNTTGDDNNADSSSALNIVLQWNPRAASVADSDGKLPITAALESGDKTWRGGIQQLLWAAPRVLETRDPCTHLYPFQLAASHCSDLETIYCLIRSLPELIGMGLFGNDVGDATTSKNAEIKKAPPLVATAPNGIHPQHDDGTIKDRDSLSSTAKNNIKRQHGDPGSLQTNDRKKPHHKRQRIPPDK